MRHVQQENQKVALRTCRAGATRPAARFFFLFVCLQLELQEFRARQKSYCDTFAFYQQRDQRHSRLITRMININCYN